MCIRSGKAMSAGLSVLDEERSQKCNRSRSWPRDKLVTAICIKAAETSEHAELGIRHLDEEKIHYCCLGESAVGRHSP